MPLAVFALGLTVFSLGTTEFIIAGLLPELAGAFGVSLPTAGLLISLFALGVAVGAPLITALSNRVPRKTALLGLLVVFVAGETVAATASTFGVLMAARVITAVAHGAFFGIGAVVAADLVSPRRRARAMSVMFGGLTVATVAGVPLGTFIGQHFGWRATFGAIAILGLVDLVAVALLVPRQRRSDPVDLRAQLRVFASRTVRLALATTALSQAALYTAYTYITPLLTEVSHFPPALVPALLVLFGIGTFAGAVVGGRSADRHLTRTLGGGLAAMAVVLGLFTLAAPHRAVMALALVAFGVAAFVINPALQTQILNHTESAPALASATNTSAFNVGNALGPWLGGLGLGSPLVPAAERLLAPSWIGAALAVVALAVVGCTARAARTRTANPHRAPAPDRTATEERR